MYTYVFSEMYYQFILPLVVYEDARSSSFDISIIHFVILVANSIDGNGICSFILLHLLACVCMSVCACENYELMTFVHFFGGVFVFFLLICKLFIYYED